MLRDALAMVPVLTVLLGVVFATLAQPPPPPPPADLFELFDAAARGADAAPDTRVALAVGANACLDLVVTAHSFLQQLGATSAATEADHSALDSLEHFMATFALYARQGKAAERFVTNATLFARLVAAAEHGVFAVGGNAALMAQGARQRGLTRVLLGGLAGSRLRALMDPAVRIVGPAGLAEDQVHLIIEYAKGEQLLPGLVAPRANRFIVSADYPNAQQAAMPAFFDALPEFAPSVVVFSGLHLLDGVAVRSRRQELLQDAVRLVRAYRASSGGQVPMHFEFASIGDKSVVHDILHSVGPLFDSIGCNEEELWSMYHALGGHELPRSAFSHSPAPRDIERALQLVLAHLPNVTRVHFHSLGLHAIATVDGAPFWRPRDELAAVVTGALTTSLRVCNVDRVDRERFEVIADLSFEPRFEPAAHWRRGSLHFFACPVLVCKKPVFTVGAGDSISSSALIRSVGHWVHRDSKEL